jgi:diguanylate cyclase (GGDEF)-like protein/PAS domain S-box-containing protein
MRNLSTPRRALEKLASALAGVFMPRRQDGTQTLRPGRFFVGSGTSLLVVVLLFACYALGELPGDALVEVTAAVVAGLIGFYLVFRTGLNRRAADPSLMVHQMVYATLVVMYAMYFTTADGVGVFPIIVLIIFLFGVLRLRTRSLLLFALFILTLDAATIALDAFFRPDAPGVHERLLQWVTLALTLPWFAMMGGYVSGLREDLRESNALQRAALEATKESESRLAEALRIAGLGSWSFHPATRVAHWSLETYRIFGIEPAQPVPMRDAFLRLVHPDDQGQYCESIVAAIDEGRSFDSEYRIVLPDSEIRWVHVVGEPEVDDNGQTTLVSGTVADITERKTHEFAIEEARDEAAAARTMLADAIKVLPEAFALFDADDRLILWNDLHAELLAEYFGIPEVVAGMKYEDQVRASVAKGEPIPLQFANDVDAFVADRVRVHRNPSHTREVKLAGERWMKISEGHTTAGGVVGVRSDITQRKQLEQRQVMQHTVTRLLADSETVGDTISEVIRTICETLGWDCGARWELDANDNVLRCIETWAVADSQIADFSKFSARQTYAASATGLILRVIATDSPQWISDVSLEPGFKRASAALAAGLHGAFAFPIRVRSRAVGAMEFFIRNVPQPDTELMGVLDSIGLQIGQFITRALAQEQLKQLAHYDFLTGLPNRNLFNDLLGRAFAKARRNRGRLALLYVDLDGFKAVNDRHGHDAGDHLLATFSRRLKDCLRDSDTFARAGASDTAARVGGDEFVVLIDDFSDVSGLAVLARRILEAAAIPFDLAGPKAHVTASIGIGIYPDDCQDVEGFIKAADTAMYEAKEHGRNGYRFFSAATEPTAALVS